MSDNIQVFYPSVIPDTPLPEQVQQDLTSSQPSSNGVSQPATTTEYPLPTKKIAVELLSQALNTRSKKILQNFEFTQSGGLQIGVFEAGVSGDIRISPIGLIARDQSGNITVEIDGDTGDAFFTGTLRSSNLISGNVAVGDGNILIDGENRRIVFYDPDTGLPVIVIGSIG